LYLSEIKESARRADVRTYIKYMNEKEGLVYCDCDENSGL
jgi:hypothetical protein